MAGKVEARLKDLGLQLPQLAAPVANYVPYVINGDLLFVSGQITLKDGTPAFIGKLGAEFSTDEGYEAAKLCGLNLISQVKSALGDLDRVRRVVRLGGFVSCTPDFTEQPQVINGASDLMVEVFGEAGRHARAAVGVPSLPRGVAVEVEGIFAFD
ncbi:RidA family protein [Telmatospirillum sp. J64-1]|uniref:RidA family protein n=1 Tax=Telmatospirillum sp. J64-1 TaxID=2502183 RepID=UPI00115E9F96|nr:RidA family protein [Telmatospirillum sp. J64-1]